MRNNRSGLERDMRENEESLSHALSSITHYRASIVACKSAKRLQPLGACTARPASMSSNTAFRTFSLANDVLEISPQDEIFRFDPEANRRLNREQPWAKECVCGVVLVTSNALI